MWTPSRDCCRLGFPFLGLLATSLLVSVCVCLDTSALNTARVTPRPFTAEYYASVSERFGAGLSTGVTVTVGGTVRRAVITDYDVGSLHIGWYSDWRMNPEPLLPGGIEYAQLIQVRASAYPTSTRDLTQTVMANPGALWIVGNEPEGKYGQGNRTPAEYAVIYHDVYTLIKGITDTAQVAIGGVIEPTPLRRKWLDMVLDEYRARYGTPMPIDVWNIHAQILREKGPFEGCGDCWGAAVPAGITVTQGMLYEMRDNADPVIFRQLVTEFRQWMKDKGFQNKPLIISEYGVLLPSDYLADDVATGDQRVIDFMRKTFDFLVNARDPSLGYPADDNRLVQQWLWYSLNGQPYDLATGLGFNGSLFSYLNPKRMTKFGVAFRTYMNVLLEPRVFLPMTMKAALLHQMTIQDRNPLRQERSRTLRADAVCSMPGYPQGRNQVRTYFFGRPGRSATRVGVWHGSRIADLR